MKNYENMLLANKKKNENKVLMAKAAIEQMLQSGEEITIQALTKNTGLSRSMFYTNEEVRSLLKTARLESQRLPYVRKKQAVLDAAMDKHISILEMEVRRLKKEIEDLKVENQELKRIVDAHTLEELKEL